MKIYNILLLLLILSTTLFLPLTKDPISYQLIPFEEKLVVITVQSPEIKISTENIPITLNVSRYNPQDNKITSILNQSGITDLTLDLEERGYYVLRFFCQLLTKVDIVENGIPLTTYLIVFGLLALFSINYVYRRFFSVPEI